MITSGLVASDPNTAPSFRTSNSFSGYNRVLSGTNPGAFIAAVPASIYAVGLIKRDSYAQNTALLAAEAFADGFALDLAFKGITGRRSLFNTPATVLTTIASSTGPIIRSTPAAFILCMPWQLLRSLLSSPTVTESTVGSPFVAYGLAGAISFSRITGSNHFPSDVFFGGAMGFVITRYAVLPSR